MSARPHRLLFVCTANICRSPMAEGLARAYADERGWAVEVQSGGVMGLEDRPADPLAVRVLKEKGVDISGHKSSGIDEEKMAWADHVLVMELRHAQKLRERFPEHGDKVLMLGTFGGMMEVPDPIGGWRWRFRRNRDDILACVRGFMDQLPPAPRAG